jgi:hypothetical protein
MEAHVSAHRHLAAAASQQLHWLLGGFALGFGVPFVFAGLLGLERDLYYGVYAVAVVGFFVLWARRTGQPLARMFARRWMPAVALGLAVAALMSLIALQQAATPRPGGLTLGAAVFWRGIVYGAADGLLLSSFPIMAVFAAFAGSPLRKTIRGTLRVGLLALVASMAMTSAYHLGYSDFRSGKLASPVAGDVVWSVPTLVTLNPIGAPIAHAGLHVTAVLHCYHTDLFLPPH